MTILTTLKSAAAALLVIAPVSAAMVMTPTAVVAEKGGKGGKGNSATRGNGNNGQSAARGNNGRGAIASELKGLNAAHASPTALANASADSMPGKLYAYQQAVLGAENQQVAVDEAAAFYSALSTMTEEEFLELNPDLDYGVMLSTAEADYLDALAGLDSAQADQANAELTLTGGRELSDDALEELHALLRL